MRRISKLAIKTCDIVTFRKAACRVSEFYDAQLAPSGLRMSEFATLVRLNRQRQINVEAFFESSTHERSTVNRNLRHLSETGLIRIAKSGTDGRGVVTMTRRGLSVLKKAVPLWRLAQDRFEALNGALLRETLNGLILEG